MIHIPKSVLQDIETAFSREWLVTNGIGGYASSTITWANTRRYHGLLIASLTPPFGRHMLFSKVDEELDINGQTYLLGCNEYHDGTIYPQGHKLIDNFRLELGIPVSEYQLDGLALKKQIWMEHEQNTVYILYELSESSKQVTLRFKPFFAFRGYHECQRGKASYFTKWEDDVLTVWLAKLPYKLKLTCAGAEFKYEENWYWNYLYRFERERGFDCLEDLYTPGLFTVRLVPGKRIILAATCEEDLPIVENALEREVHRRRSLIHKERSSFRQHLLLAADQFIVRLPSAKRKYQRQAIVAGYHWFTDWGRDTMISLPGLLLSTGRLDEARNVLLDCVRYFNQGMLPNRFSDEGKAEYNTADATLWYFQTIYHYIAASGYVEIIHKLFPYLKQIIESHIEGTKFGIRVDSNDYLLFAGLGRSQVTWMDACVNGKPVTPRVGKPVEINALWYNALCLMACWAKYVGESAQRYESLASRCAASFRRKFWHEGGYLYDVIDSNGKVDDSFRPNQIIAVSLPFSPLKPHQQKLIVDAVEHELLTPYGLRTLSPRNPQYCGTYSGGPIERDSAYHQGTAWPWLLGQFADAHYKVYRDLGRIKELLQPFKNHLSEAGVGSISELFDGDPPHNPGGCIAQAWSVGEILRILTSLKTLE